MNLKFYLKKLQENNDFKSFVKDNPSAYLCSGFFTIDKDGGDNKQHLDFFMPETNKMLSFQIETGKSNPMEVYNNHIPQKILLDFDIDFSEVEEKINKKMRTQGINNRVQKIILALQKVGGKRLLSGTVFLSMFGLLKISIDLETNELIDFEKKSFFDMINVFKKNN